MKRPSAIQVALLMVCGSMLAGYSCFYTADNHASAFGRLGFAAGLVALACAAIALVMPRRDAAVPEPVDRAADQSAVPDAAPQKRPTLGQAFSLGLCGFLLFFFGCGGAIIPVRSGSPLTVLGVIGMVAGAVFTLWGLVGFAMALGRRFSRSR